MNTKKDALLKIQEAFPINAERDALISHIDADDPLRAFYEVVMDNQLAYNKKQSQYDTMDFGDAYSRMALYELKGLRIMHDMVGFQPMTGPVSDIYTLRTTSREAGRMSLEILKEEIEAGSKKTSAGLNLTDWNVDVEDEEQIKRAGYEIADDHVHEMYNIMSMFASGHDDYDVVTFDDSAEDQDLAISRFICEINIWSNKIANRTRRGTGNYIIVGTDVLHLLQKHSSFEAVEMGGNGVMKYAGKLNKWHKVYHYKYADNRVTIGYKGPTEIDAGLYFNPYVPIMSAGPVINPITFEPMLCFMTRYNMFADKVSKDYFSGFEVEFV